MQVDKPGHPPVLEGYKEGPHPLISGGSFNFLHFAQFHDLITFPILDITHRFCTTIFFFSLLFCFIYRVKVYLYKVGTKVTIPILDLCLVRKCLNSHHGFDQTRIIMMNNSICWTIIVVLMIVELRFRVFLSQYYRDTTRLAAVSISFRNSLQNSLPPSNSRIRFYSTVCREFIKIWCQG